MIFALVLALLVAAGCTDTPPATTTDLQPAAGADAGQPAAGADGVGAAANGEPVIRLSRAQGRAGSEVVIEASLSGGGGQIVATATDIRYDSARARVASTDKGVPACEVDPAIGASGPINKQIFAKERVADGEAVLRVGLLGVGNANPLPDGTLFRCRFAIPGEAPAGEVALAVETQASNAAATEVTVRGGAGAIVVN